MVQIYIYSYINKNIIEISCFTASCSRNCRLPGILFAGEDSENSFLTIGVGLENRLLYEDLRLDKGEALLPCPFELTELLLELSGVAPLECLLHEFILGAC